MNRDHIIERLRSTQADLRQFGVRHAALFGSRARGEARLGSDIDIMLEFDPDARITVFDLVGIKEYVADLFEGPVDVVDKAGLKPRFAAEVEAAALYAF